MRFLALSIIINLIILFVPINLHFIQINKPELKAEKQINLKLNIKKPEPKKEPKILPPKPKIEKILEKKPEIKPRQEIIQKPKPKPKPKKIKKAKKLTKIKKKQTKAQKTEKSPNLKPNYTELKPTKKAVKTEILASKNTQISQEKIDFCAENIGFEILEKPSVEYPKKAKRLRMNKIFKVDVHFKLSQNNEISITKVVGENEIFNNEAKKRTMKMKIKALNKSVANCIIIQPYKFVP